MSSGMGVRLSDINPADWAWYREFGAEAAVPPTIRQRNRRVARRAARKAAVATLAASAVIAGSWFLSARDIISWPTAVFMAVTASVVLALYAEHLRSRAVTARRRNVAAAVRAARADRVLGATVSARHAPHATEALLEMLLSVPGLVIFHRIGVPGLRAAVDHAVACGNLVYLLDSVDLGGGMWEWARGNRDALVPTFRGSKPRALPLHRAADELRTLLGPDIEVVPIVVVHGARTAPGGSSLSRHDVHLVAAGATMERIGNTCAYGLAGATPPPQVQETLRSLLV